MGTATHNLYDLLESVFGSDVHLGLTQDTDLEGEDDRAEELEEELPEGTSVPADTAPLSETSKEMQQAIKSSLQNAADDGEDVTAAAPTKQPTDQPHSSQFPQGTK